MIQYKEGGKANKTNWHNLNRTIRGSLGAVGISSVVGALGDTKEEEHSSATSPNGIKVVYFPQLIVYLYLLLAKSGTGYPYIVS